MSKVNVDPRIMIRVVPDGEVHIAFKWTKDDLAQMAMAFLAVSDGKMKAEEAAMIFRLRDREAIDYGYSVFHKIWAAETTRLKRVDEAATTTPCKDRISAWTKAPKRRPMLCT